MATVCIILKFRCWKEGPITVNNPRPTTHVTAVGSCRWLSLYSVGSRQGYRKFYSTKQHSYDWLLYSGRLTCLAEQWPPVFLQDKWMHKVILLLLLCILLFTSLLRENCELILLRTQPIMHKCIKCLRPWINVQKNTQHW